MTYSPYDASGSYPSGPVTLHPWVGEDFSQYGAAPGVPVEVECSSDKGKRSHLEVTSGCLDAVLIGSQNQYTRGQVRCPDSDFRVLALGRAAGYVNPVKWTDCTVKFRFHGHQTGDTNYPGVKAFNRYRTEDDLYVASWRWDGVAQIQRKWLGDYVVLAIADDYGPPSADAWHTMEFSAIGTSLALKLDDVLVLQTTSGTFSWGTCGIRIDGTDGCYIDDWMVY